MQISELIEYVNPGKQWSLIGNPLNEQEYDESLVWLSDGDAPTWAALKAAEPQAEYDQAYNVVSLARASAYAAPGGSDGIFFKYQRGEATEQEWLDAVQAINDANPYPVKAK